MNKNNVLHAVKWFMVANVLVTLIFESKNVTNILFLEFRHAQLYCRVGVFCRSCWEYNWANTGKIWGFVCVYVVVPVVT